MTSISRKIRKLDKIFFKCKNTCKEECLRKAELQCGKPVSEKFENAVGIPGWGCRDDGMATLSV